MSSATGQTPDDSARYQSFFSRRSRLVWILFTVLAGLVLLFNVASIYMPLLIGAPVWPGSVMTFGMIFGYLIVLLIVLASICYVRWTNSELLKLQAGSGKQEPQS
jgi:uncharacterized membrane protein (DUF485 family)